MCQEARDEAWGLVEVFFFFWRGKSIVWERAVFGGTGEQEEPTYHQIHLVNQKFKNVKINLIFANYCNSLRAKNSAQVEIGKIQLWESSGGYRLTDW